MVSLIVAVRDGVSVELQADKSSNLEEVEEMQKEKFPHDDHRSASGVDLQAAKLPNQEAKPHDG